MLLFVGLGNPGIQYDSTRHNIGFAAIDEIVEKYKFSKIKSKWEASLFEGTIDGKKILCIKPESFMNNSGIPASQAARFYKIENKNIYVFHDDLDLSIGKSRIKLGGGNAGHNGLKSLDEHIGNEYWRVRIGIGHPGDRDKVHSYVLGKFTKDEQLVTQKITATISENIDLLVNKTHDSFMSKVAEAITPPRPKPVRKNNNNEEE